jgi:hypothetical protein
VCPEYASAPTEGQDSLIESRARKRLPIPGIQQHAGLGQWVAAFVFGFKSEKQLLVNGEDNSFPALLSYTIDLAGIPINFFPPKANRI